MKCRIYIDEVGNPDLESSDDPNHRFLSLTGVVLDLEYVRSVLHPRMEALKERYFRPHPDDHVVFHRKDLLNARPPFQCLADPDIRAEFDEALLALLEECDYTVMSVCIDKKRHKETYTVWRYDPYHYCLTVLLERFCLFLNRTHSVGDVMAESRGGKEDMRLKNAFHRIWHRGTNFIGPELLQKVLTSRQLKVRPKAHNIAGLQLADLVAHPSRNEILLENDLRTKKLPPFAQRIVAILGGKYDQDQGRLFGKKLL
jgi:hypothetical protein